MIHDLSLYTVEPALSNHSREAKNLAAEGRWLFNPGQIYREMLILENSKWLLKVIPTEVAIFRTFWYH